MTDTPHPKAKPVREPATGLTWSSAADVARELGCIPTLVYRHLSDFRSPKTIYGRSFEYMQGE